MELNVIKRLAVAAALGFGVSNGASAAPCAGPSPFTDVPQGASFCTDTEWLANRAITLGCGGTNFCPNDPVTRASMALFMQRLGTVLSPTYLNVDTSTGAVDLDLPTPNVVCQSADTPAAAYPRLAVVHSTFAGQAAGALDYTHDVVVSVDSGTTWNYVTGTINRSGTAAAHWISSSQTVRMSLGAGTAYRFGIAIARQGAGSMADFTTGRCFVTAQIHSRTGTSTPFDSDVTSTVSDR